MAESKLDTIVKREYLERVKSKWFVIGTLLGPLFMGLLLFLPAIMGERERKSESGTIRVVDATPDSVGSLVVTSLRGGVAGDGSRAELRTVGNEAALSAAEAEAVRDVLGGSIVGYLLLDARGLESGRVKYSGRNTTALVTMQHIESAVTRAALARQLEASGIDGNRSSALASLRMRVETQRLSASGRGSSGRVSVLFAIGVAVTLYLTIFMHGSNVMRGVLEEKQTRVAEVVLSSVPSDTLLFGKVLGIGAVGFTQLIVWTIVSTGILAIRAPLLSLIGVRAEAFALPELSLALVVIIVLSFVLGFLFYAALFAGVGAIVNTEQDAQQAQLPVVLLLVMSLAMVQGIITNPEGGLATLMTLLPFSSPIILPIRLSLTTVPQTESMASLGILLVSSIAATFVASRLYRTGVLMYGKRPSLREAWRWMRTK